MEGGVNDDMIRIVLRQPSPDGKYLGVAAFIGTHGHWAGVEPKRYRREEGSLRLLAVERVRRAAK